MNTGLVRMGFIMGTLIALGAASFHVFNAPQRKEQRLATARNVCIGSGGEWVRIQGEAWCRSPIPASADPAAPTLARQASTQ